MRPATRGRSPPQHRLAMREACPYFERDLISTVFMEYSYRCTSFCISLLMLSLRLLKEMRLPRSALIRMFLISFREKRLKRSFVRAEFITRANPMYRSRLNSQTSRWRALRYSISVSPSVSWSFIPRLISSSSSTNAISNLSILSRLAARTRATSSTDR